MSFADQIDRDLERRRTALKKAEAEIAALRAEIRDHEIAAEEYAATRARVEALEAALRECADDLEAEVRATHGADRLEGVHPSQDWKFQRDMEPVDRARALLEQKP